MLALLVNQSLNMVVIKISMNVAGFARNYLYPTKKVLYATEANILRHSLPYVEHLLPSATQQ